jgi:hypothetical protein
MVQRVRFSRSLLLLALAILGVAPVRASVPPLGGADDLRLAGNRFQVVASWQTPSGLHGPGHAIPLTADTGAFWFFAPENVELVVKVLDACAPPFGRFWVFAGGLTDVAVTLTVTDFATGKVQTYGNAQGQAFLPIQDTGAFAGCPDLTPHACGQGTAAEIAATPRGDTAAEALALAMGGGFTAWPWLYERVHADLDSIRAQQPEVDQIFFLPQLVPNALILTFQPAAADQIQAGTYHAWDCLNQWYRGDVKNLHSQTVFAVNFPGRYDMRRVLADYAPLPGVSSIEIDSLFFIDPFSFLAGDLCATVNGTALNYYARPGADSRIFYYASQPGSAPVLQGIYVPASSLPTPSWVADAFACFH